MSLKDIVGHERQIAVLGRIIRQGTPGKAYLFFGPAGVGKQTAAREFARALLCLSESDDSCGHCRSCEHLDRETHPDFRYAEPEKKTFKIEQVREVQGFLSLTPAWGTRKVALLDGAERMNEAAANALLKTLEEPPPGVTVILVSSNLNAFPPTVVSRCQRVSFGPLNDGETRRVLLGKGRTEEEVEVGTALSYGSPGLVMDLENEAFKKPRAALEGLVAAVGKGSRSAILSGVEKMTVDRAGVDFMVKMLLRNVRSVLRHRLGIDSGDEPVPPRALEDAEEDQLLWLAERLVETSGLLEGNVNPKLALGRLFTEWIDRADGSGPVSARTVMGTG